MARTRAQALNPRRLVLKILTPLKEFLWFRPFDSIEVSLSNHNILPPLHPPNPQVGFTVTPKDGQKERLVDQLLYVVPHMSYVLASLITVGIFLGKFQAGKLRVVTAVDWIGHGLLLFYVLLMCLAMLPPIRYVCLPTLEVQDMHITDFFMTRIHSTIGYGLDYLASQLQPAMSLEREEGEKMPLLAPVSSGCSKGAEGTWSMEVEAPLAMEVVSGVWGFVL